MGEDKLETRIEELKRRLDMLGAAKVRRDFKEPCPNPDSHVIQILTCVGGPVIEKVKKLTGFELTTSGYQIGRCLVCGEYILKNYDGSYVGIVSKEDATRLC